MSEALRARAAGIHAVFFDIDGTLYSPVHHHIPESTFRAFRELKERGILRIICTGRAMQELKNLPLERLEPDALIVMNGMLAVDAAGHTEISHPFSQEQTRQIVQLFETGLFPMALVERQDMYLNHMSPEAVTAQEKAGIQVPPEGTWQGDPVYMAVAYVDEKGRKQLEKQLPGFQITSWSDWGVDIVPKTAGKAASLLEWAALHDLSAGQLMAFGDGENDAGMLQVCGIGVAMEKCHPAACGAADYVCEDIDRDGLWNALTDFGLTGRPD